LPQPARHKVRRAAVNNILGPKILQECYLLSASDDVDEWHIILPTKPHHHLAEIGSGSGMDERRMTFPAHRLHHPQCGERVDKRRRSVVSRQPLRKNEAVGGLDDLVLCVGASCRSDRDHAPDERGDFASGSDDRTGSLVPDRQCLIKPPRHGCQPLRRNAPLDDWPIRRATGA
jgi:hypothetical protein